MGQKTQSLLEENIDRRGNRPTRDQYKQTVISLNTGYDNICAVLNYIDERKKHSQRELETTKGCLINFTAYIHPSPYWAAYIIGMQYG